jgi:hypothetical protein
MLSANAANDNATKNTAIAVVRFTIWVSTTTYSMQQLTNQQLGFQSSSARGSCEIRMIFTLAEQP